MTNRGMVRARSRQSGLVLGAVFALAWTLVSPQHADAVMPEYGPTRSSPLWASDRVSCLDGSDAGANSTFLSNFGNYSSSDSLIFQDLISTKRAQEMKQDYILRTRDYDQRRDAGIVTTDLETTHTAQMTDFSHSVMNEVQSYEGNKVAKRAEQIANENDDIKNAEKPVAVAGVLYGIYSDKAFSFKLRDDTTLTGHTNVRAQKGGLTVNSPIVTGAVDVDNQATAAWSPNPVVPDPTTNRERYRVSVSKPIPTLALTSSVAYGGTSNAAIASVSRPIFNHLTCQVDSVHPIDDMGGYHPAEQRLKFFYHLDF